MYEIREPKPFIQVCKKFLIYGLVDPETAEVRYIGKSSRGLKRPYDHMKFHFLKKDISYKGNWIRSLMKLGLKPKVIVLEEFDSHEGLNDAEIFWIKEYRSNGSRLTNLTDGGDGCFGRSVSEETRKKIGIANSGDKNWMYGRSPTNKGLPMSEEQKQKLRSHQKNGAKAVVCLNDGREFSSAKEAAKFYKVDRNSIGQICRGKTKTMYSGLKFRFVVKP